MITREGWAGYGTVKFGCGCEITFKVDYNYDDVAGIQGDELTVWVDDYKLCKEHDTEEIREVLKDDEEAKNILLYLCDEVLDVGLREFCEEEEFEVSKGLREILEEVVPLE